MAVTISSFENENEDALAGLFCLEVARKQISHAIGHFEELKPHNSPILLQFQQKLRNIYHDISHCESLY